MCVCHIYRGVVVGENGKNQPLTMTFKEKSKVLKGCLSWWFCTLLGFEWTWTGFSSCLLCMPSILFLRLALNFSFRLLWASIWFTHGFILMAYLIESIYIGCLTCQFLLVELHSYSLWFPFLGVSFCSPPSNTVLTPILPFVFRLQSHPYWPLVHLRLVKSSCIAPIEG